MQAAIAGGADGIIFGGESYEHEAITVMDYEKAWHLAQKANVRLDFNLPRIMKDDVQPFFEKILTAAKKFPPAAVHVHNIAQAALVKRLTDFAVHADYSLIAYNKSTLSFFKDYGMASATLSPELKWQQMEGLAKHSPLPLSAIVHGRLELMVSEYCVTGSFLGNLDKGACSHPCTQGRYALKDRKEAVFPLRMDQFCHMHVLNSKTLSMLPHAMKFKAAGVDTLQIEAKAMTEKEITAIVRAYLQAMKLPADLDEVQEAALKTQEGSDITRGHYFRGVL